MRDVVKSPRSVIMVRCLSCQHHGIIAEDDLVRFRLKPGAPIAQFVKRLRCRKCGSGSEALAKELHGRRMSLRKISATLAAQGHLTANGKPYVASAVQAMVGQGCAPDSPVAISESFAAFPCYARFSAAAGKAAPSALCESLS
jgi:hypothetical protein